MAKTLGDMKAGGPQENHGMEELLKQLEAEGWTKIEEAKKKEKDKGFSLIDETHRLLREYDNSVNGKIGATPDGISYKHLEQKTKEFLGLQKSLDRRLYLEETPVMKGAESLLNGIERIAKRPVIKISPTEDIFTRYFQVGDELNELLDQSYEHYQERMDGVKGYKDGRVLRLFVESMDKKKVIESEMQRTNRTFAETGKQLSGITKSHQNFARLYIAYNNLRREVKGLANELEKTCQRLVIKNQEMRIMSDHEERLGNAVAIFDRERAYLADIMEHAQETQSIYQFSKELKTGVASVHDSASSLSGMVYNFVGRVLQSSQEIARMEASMENDRMMPKILEGLSKNYGISLTGTRAQIPSFVSAAEMVVKSAGTA